MAQADATYPIADGMFQKHSEGLTEGSGYAVGAKGSELSTGDLRRKYNFGDRVSEVSIAQDPFFRFLSKVAKRPVDDPQFKWAEKRPSFHKRYAYVSGWIDNSNVDDNQAKIEIYQAADGQSAIEIRLENDTLWLSQAQLAALFGKDTDTISLHLKNIYNEGELNQEATTEESSVIACFPNNLARDEDS